MAVSSSRARRALVASDDRLYRSFALVDAVVVVDDGIGVHFESVGVGRTVSTPSLVTAVGCFGDCFLVPFVMLFSCVLGTAKNDCTEVRFLSTVSIQLWCGCFQNELYVRVSCC